MKAWFLKLHRWVALVFALPLLFVFGTGLILSVEPWLVTSAIAPNSLTPAGIEALLSKHDPAGRAASLTYRSYDGTLTTGGGRGGPATVVDAATGDVRSGPSTLANALVTARQIHERLIFDLGWLVAGSSMAMLVLASLGVLMGWPRIANSLAGWHKAMAWGLLPFIILSPLTGLLMSFGVTFSGPPPAVARGASMTLPEAVRVVGRDHDLSSLVWLRASRGGQFLARLVEGGEYTVYAVAPGGAVALPRNWPRLWHEGNFAAVWPALINLVTAIAMAGLLVTGLSIWLRRQFRKRFRQAGKKVLA
jgi:uncharacterized iron-regulated membrane protein